MLIISSVFIVFSGSSKAVYSGYVPPYDIDTAIQKGLEYIERHYYEINSTHAVCLDLPGLSFRIKRNDGKWVITGKETGHNYPDNPGGDQIAGGALAELVQPMGKIGEPEKMRFKFDIDGNGDYNDVILYVEYVSINETWMKCEGTIEKADLKGYGPASLWLGTEVVIDSITEGASFVRQKKYGWVMNRYVNRHVTRMLANLYNYMAKLGWWEGNGINYTERAQKLLNTWYGAGYSYDIYDPLYGFDAINDGRPDYYKVFHSGGIFNYSWIVSQKCFPDPELWTNLPVICDDTKFAYPYRSRLGYEYARDTWLYGFGNLAPRSAAVGGYPVVADISGINLGVPTVWGTNNLAKLSWAIYLMLKYGTKEPYFSQAKYYITTRPWNGLGIPYQEEAGIKLWTDPAYGTHCTVAYAIALLQYYTLTGDSWAKERAKEVIGVILELQQREGLLRPVGAYGKMIYRADGIGGFMVGYKFGGGFEHWDSVVTIPGLNQLYGLLKFTGVYYEDPIAYPGVAFTNTEATVPSVMALILYKKILGNEAPTLPLDPPEFIVPFPTVSSVTYTESEQGARKIDLSEAEQGYIRVGVMGSIFGETWYKITFTWNDIKISQTLYDFRTRLIFYYPVYYAQDGNSLEIWVEIYDSNGFLVVSDYRKPKELDGISGGTEYLISYDNLTMLSSLSPGTYTFKLILRFSCGWVGALGVGMNYDDLLLGWHEYGKPMEILLFGYDSDPPEVINEPTYKVAFSSQGDDGSSQIKINFTMGVVYYLTSADTAVFTYQEQIAIFEVRKVADGFYFWYWHVENRKLGISENITANPMYWKIDHDYNITACFGSTERPPWDYALLQIDVQMILSGNKKEGSYYTQVQLETPAIPTVYHYNGSAWIAGTGSWKYLKGTTITLNASLPNGYQFIYWWPPFSFSRIQELNLTTDTYITAAYAPPYVHLYFKNAETGQPLSSAYITYGSNSWLVKDGATIIAKNRQYEIKVHVPGYYDEVINITPDASSPEVTVELYPIQYSSGGGGGGEPPTFYTGSKLMTFYAVIPWSNYTSNYYVDGHGLIYCEPLPGKNATIKIVIHYDTYYPIVEIHAKNVAYVKFNIKQLYQYYCKEKYDAKIATGKFTGLLIDVNKPLTVEIQGLSSKPNEVWKTLPEGETYKIEEWSWLPTGSLVLSFMPGDPTVSVLWGSLASTINDMVFQIAIVAIALACITALTAIVKRYIE